MIPSLIFEHLYPQLGVILAPVWAGGVLLATSRARAAPLRAGVVALICAALLYGLASSVTGLAGPGAAALVSVRGVQVRAQWWGVALLVALCAQPGRPARPHAHPWRSLLPLLALAGQGYAALVTGVVVTGRAALEPGRPRRALLLSGLAFMVAAHLLDLYSLPIWIRLNHVVGQGWSEILIDLGEQALRALAWVDLLSWALRMDPPGDSFLSRLWLALRSHRPPRGPPDAR